MERLDVEVQYRAAKWLFTNMFFEGEITIAIERPSKNIIDSGTGGYSELMP